MTFPVTELQEHLSVVLYPTLARRCTSQDVWNLRISGAVFQPELLTLRRRMMIRVLRRLMQADATEVEGPIFKKRIRGFLLQAQRGQRIAVQVGDKQYWLPKPSRRNGHFSSEITACASEIENLQNNGVVQRDWLPVRLSLPEQDQRDYSSQILLLPDQGVSVISDIDDTIKISDVGSRKNLLTNTFLREFQSVDGMSMVYRQWAAEGARFHYVSSSPWQLYDPLVSHVWEDGFPVGTVHLRHFRLRDQLGRLAAMRHVSKRQVIRSILKSFPQRRFILVGDSGEGDPEMYAGLARRFPNQVLQILIREVPRRPMSVERLRRVTRKLDPQLWQVFTSAEEVPTSLQQIQGLSKTANEFGTAEANSLNSPDAKIIAT